MPRTIAVEPHPLLEPGVFAIRTAQPCGELATPDAIAQLAPSDAVNAAVRDLLRHGGYKPSGQTIDAGGLVCVYDAEGPTGTPVKDAQRTKTHAGTRATLAVVWGTRALLGRTAETTRWYRGLVAQIAGATTDDVALA